MDYKKYIDLGFKRQELNDQVEFNQTGYYGFCLTKNITNNMLIEATSGELDKPKLYIRKRNQETYHIINITKDMVMDLLNENNYTEDNFTSAC